MLAFGYKQASETPHEGSIMPTNMAKPVPAGRDLLISVRAISVNPVDTKIRRTVSPQPDEFKVLGWDAVGIVEQTGHDCSLFNVGDRVFYAGDISRAGSNAEYQLVDERIVGKAPQRLNDAQAAALPLTALTAWELLFSRLQVPADEQGAGQSILIVGAAGGVGSIMIQLAKQLTSLNVIATASRPETRQWVKELGADVVVDHSHALDEQLARQGVESVDYVASLTHTDQHFEACVSILKPQGKFGLIDDPASISIGALKRKSISLHWEFMYTRSLFNTPDIQEQHTILNRVAELVDNQTLTTTLGEHLGVINADNLIKAHQIIESGKAKGKLVLEGFELVPGVK
ncbi:zinc-binding alcohol dehydrogenase family protein [Salinimonas lutimaris]|uniref:zinc-binding alcohol dehydrogenase family protein n=1 Tax=Salinimonas lutimaris TaxID=914153 RepID=UPI0010C0C2F1|nr:zinc-binding alcohol dehydrogenase family protein [Salinimonas lutimaris]